MTDTPASSATCARVTRFEPTEDAMTSSLAGGVYRYTHDGDVPSRSAHLDRVRDACLVRLPSGGARAGHRAPAQRARPELLDGRAARGGVRGGEHDRGPDLRAARGRARAAQAVLVIGRADGRWGDRADGGEHR